MRSQHNAENDEGSFPDVKKVLPKGSVKPTTSVALQAKYVALVGKVFGSSACVKISSYGDDSQHPVRIECGRSMRGENLLRSADAMLIIMQCRF